MAEKKTAATPAPERWGPMEVAEHIQKRYSTARDMMLTGKFGTVKRDGRHMTVLADRVREWKASEK